MQDEDKKIEEFIRENAGKQTPDAWARIERRIKDMDKQPSKKTWKLPVIISSAACLVAAVVLVSVFAFSKPNPGQSAVLPSPTAIASTTPIASAPSTAPSTEVATVREPIPYSTSTTLQPDKGSMIKIMTYETIKDLAHSQYATDIVYLKFKKELGPKAAEGDAKRLFTYYEMEVVKVWKGNLKPGDTITVKTMGGANDKVWIEDNFVERFTGDFDYILFTNTTQEDGKNIYQLASSFQGYVPVQDGKVSLNTKIEYNGLYNQGESTDALFTRIQDAVK